VHKPLFVVDRVLEGGIGPSGGALTVFGANLSHPTGSLDQRQKPKEAKSRKRNFLFCSD